MVKQIKAVKRNAKGDIILASLTDGTTVSVKEAIFLTKVKEIEGAVIATNPFSGKERLHIQNPVEEIPSNQQIFS